MENNDKKKKYKNIIEWIICIVIAVTLALIVRYFIGTPTIVQQSSMYPTLEENQRLILNRIVRTTNALPQRGDIITFEKPSKSILNSEELNISTVAKYDNEPQNLISKFIYYVLEINKKSYIKRVIGLPGEHIEIKNGKVYINDQILDESEYLTDEVITDKGKGLCVDLIVPEGCVFTLGDNRTASMDSRCFGCIPLEKIEGKVWIRITPLSKWGYV